MTKPRVGLVCSGGGARGAYEAGVIRYLREELPATVRPHVRFDVLSGTSVGASTCCYLAATMHTPDQQGRGLAALWTGL
ncbi:MAG TPA: patatin-like phospholipase family protein, partial [Archangium sp.]